MHPICKIKPRNAEEFESMAAAAGAPAGVDRGVSLAGANYKAGQFSIGAIDYYSADIMNIAYGEITYKFLFPNRVSLALNAQYTDQHSTGQDLLTSLPFSAHQSGLKLDLGMGAVLLTVARTWTAVGSRTSKGGTDIQSPWGSYPGYTSVQIEDFYRAGEDATLLRAAYNFPKITGLSVYTLWVHGSTPRVEKQYAQNECDVNLQWRVPSGAAKGLSLRARYGHVSQGGPKDQHADDLRFIVSYALR
jgi:hypothetical protein